jgi:flotillin
MDNNLVVAGTVGVLAVGVTFLLSMFGRYRKVGPNEALIISGFRGSRGRGFRIVRGGGTFVVPLLEKADVLSLEVMTIDVHTPDVYTMQGVPVEVDGVAQLKVDSNDEATVATAAEQFLGRGRNDIMNVAKQTVEGHLRAILGSMEVEEIYKDREKFAQNVQHVAATDLKNMGLKIVSFTLRDIKDANGYLDALGKPRLAEVKRDASVRESRMLAEAQIAQTQANRDAAIESAQNAKQGEVARLKNAEETAAAARDLELKKAEYQASINQKKADADLAYDLQRFKTNQLVKKEEVQVAVVEKDQQIQVQEKEILRRVKELDATVNKPADAQRYAAQVDADAKKYRAVAEANGRAEADKAEGFARADVVAATGKAEAEAIRLKGQAEAEVLRAKGLAEAEAMKAKAASYSQYNAAAVTEMFVKVLPEIANAISLPLSRLDKITVVSTGGADGAGTGASKITQDVAQMIAQLPPVVESITGVSLADLVGRIPGLTDLNKPAVEAPRVDKKQS